MYKSTLKTSHLYIGLKKQAEVSAKKLKKRHPHVFKILAEKGITPGRIREHAARVAAAGAMASAVLFGQPAIAAVTRPDTTITKLSANELRQQLKNQLSAVLPKTVEPLTPTQEDAISHSVQAIWGIDARAEFQGERLNRNYGLIGAEQHLPRYPGDTVAQHDAYQQAGITPGRGAWGYFAPSQNELTQDLIQKEKWYVAVQTLYLHDWQTRLPYLRDWWQYRKVLVINPKNGKTVVADVADSGPANWTGKHFGGSPEVMAYLESKDGAQRGPVVLFFVNDPNNEIPLGPVEYNIHMGPAIQARPAVKVSPV